MMTINEAIEHAEWCAENSCGECADEHRQLAEWLRELVTLRKIIAIREDTTWQAIHEHEELKSLNASLRGAAQGLGRLCDRYKAENAKLREYLKMACKVIDVATVSGCYNVSVSEMKHMHDELHELGIEVE